MEDEEIYINVQIIKPALPSPSTDRLISPDSELNIGKDEPLVNEDEDPPIFSRPGKLRVTASTDCLTSTDSELNIGKEKPLIDEDEDAPIFSRPGRLRVTAQTDCLTSTDSELNIRKDETFIDEDEDPPIASRPGGRRVTAPTDRLTSTDSELKIRKEEPLSDEDEDVPNFSRPADLRVTAQTAAHEQQTRVKVGNRPNRLICLLCLVTSALIVIVAGLSIHVTQIRQSLKQMHSDLRHQFTEVETKYRSINETKAQICELLTSRREQTCPQNWIKNEDRCYFIFSLEKSYDGARGHCSNFDARLLEINSDGEEEFVSTSIGYVYRIYWIGKCRDGNVAPDLLYTMFYRPPTCSRCGSRSHSCNSKYGFICEKSAHLYPEIPEEIQSLCQHPVGPTSIT